MFILTIDNKFIIRGVILAREKFKTLTEQMFYALICLKQECSGIDILDRVPEMTKGRVNIGSGTLYTLLEQFVKEDMIREIKSTGRKRNYIITDKGREKLVKECIRLESQLNDFNRYFKGEV